MNKIKFTLDQERNDIIDHLSNLPEENPEWGHKFVYTNKRELIIRKTSDTTPKHGDLGGEYEDKAIIAAGWVKLEKKDSHKNEITLTNKSKRYGRPFETLEKVEFFLYKIFSLDNIKSEDYVKSNNN